MGRSLLAAAAAAVRHLLPQLQLVVVVLWQVMLERLLQGQQAVV
jgi:hypothetical protein